MERTAMTKVCDLIYEMYQSDELSDDQFAKLRVAVEYDGIPKEREQIEDAWRSGDINFSHKETAEQYYSSKYEQK